MKTATFEVRTADHIPEMSEHEFNQRMQASEFYFIKVRTIGGEESRTIGYYDFKNCKWRLISGSEEDIIEYYVPCETTK